MSGEKSIYKKRNIESSENKLNVGRKTLLIKFLKCLHILFKYGLGTKCSTQVLSLIKDEWLHFEEVKKNKLKKFLEAAGFEHFKEQMYEIQNGFLL